MGMLLADPADRTLAAGPSAPRLHESPGLYGLAPLARCRPRLRLHQRAHPSLRLARQASFSSVGSVILERAAQRAVAYRGDTAARLFDTRLPLRTQ